jgi:hypothetical protein
MTTLLISLATDGESMNQISKENEHGGKDNGAGHGSQI